MSEAQDAAEERDRPPERDMPRHEELRHLVDEENARRLTTCGVVILLLCELPILQRRIALGSNRPSLTDQGSAETELTQVWEARRARYHAVADVTYDVSAESADMTEDLERKAADIAMLLHQSPRFRPA